MRGLLVERLRPFALIAFGASAVLHLALAAAAICALQLLHRLPILGSVVLLGALFLYAADCVRGNAFASAGRAVDRDLVPAAIANSLDALRDIRLLRTFLGSPGMLALLDVPWLLVYLCAIAWIHPLLGLAGLLGAALLIFGLAIAGELQKPERSDSMLLAARRAHDQPKIWCAVPRRWSEWACRTRRLQPGASDTSIPCRVGSMEIAVLRDSAHWRAPEASRCRSPCSESARCWSSTRGSASRT